MYNRTKLLLGSMLLLLSCASAPVERGWRVSGPAFRGPTEIVLGEGTGVLPVSIRSVYLGQNVELKGSARPAETGEGWEIEIAELSYFGNWSRGWTEAVLEAGGSLRLLRSGDRWVAEVLEKPTLGSVRSAEVRYMDTFITGDRAIRAVANRMERIRAAVAFRREGGADAWFDRPERKRGLLSRGSPSGYAEAYGSLFFPERYGYGPGTEKTGPWTEGDGISWDSGYTRKVFPEQLREVRDSGTLYRDWEEGIGLWFLVDQWQPFWEQAFPSEETIIIAFTQGA